MIRQSVDDTTYVGKETPPTVSSRSSVRVVGPKGRSFLYMAVREGEKKEEPFTWRTRSDRATRGNELAPRGMRAI